MVSLYITPTGELFPLENLKAPQAPSHRPAGVTPTRDF